MQVPETLGPRDFARLLGDRYGLRMSHQAVSKAAYLPKRDGRIVVHDALAVLAARERIQLDGAPVEAPADVDELEEPANGRPRKSGGGGGYYDELTLTERVKRRKLEMELEEKAGKLLRIEDVTEAMIAGARRIAERLDRVPALAARLAGAAREGGDQAIKAILLEEVRAIRETLSESLRLGADQEGGDDEP